MQPAWKCCTVDGNWTAHPVCDHIFVSTDCLLLNKYFYWWAYRGNIDNDNKDAHFINLFTSFFFISLATFVNHILKVNTCIHQCKLKFDRWCICTAVFVDKYLIENTDTLFIVQLLTLSFLVLTIKNIILTETHVVVDVISLIVSGAF